MINQKYLLTSSKIQLLSFKWIFIFIAFVGLSSFCTFEIKKISHAVGVSMNIFDVFFYQFGVFMYVYLIITPLYIFFVSGLVFDKGLDNYIFSRINNKISLWFNKLIILTLFTTFCLALGIGISIMIGGVSFDLSILWSEGAFVFNQATYHNEINYINEEFLSVNPTIVFGYLLIFMFFWLLSVGILISMISLYTKKTAFGFLTGITINFIAFICFKFNDTLQHIQLFPYQHTLLQFRENSFNVFNTKSISFSLLYWIILITILTFVSFHIYRKTDFVFEVRNDD